jgi:stringent starvation protein B
MQYAKDGRIVLDLSPKAVHNLTMDNHYVNFKARFGAATAEIYAPINAILAIYAQENGAGLVFEPQDPGDEDNNDQEVETKGAQHPGPSSKEDSSKPKLTLVKS